jgi:dolichol kinase
VLSIIGVTSFKFLLTFLIAYLSGLLVKYKNVKVNYTRKIDQLFLFFIPALVDYFFTNNNPSTSFMIINQALFMLVSFIIFIEPVRNKVSIIATAFSSFDRPEDRPHTLLWFASQGIIGYIVLVPVIAIFNQYHMLEMLSIPIFITVFGDGLAEPIGIRFGKHKYTTYSLFPRKKYVRSLEGSLTVFITGIIVVFMFMHSFNNTQFLLALATIPIAMTLTEAVSPHTLDNPLLVIIGSGLTFVIKNLC